MRYVSAARVIVLSGLLVLGAFGQGSAPGLSITNYQFVTETRISRTHSDFVYRADIVNSGTARPSVAATVTSTVPSVQVIVGALHFSNVPVNGQVTSTDTFTIRVDRTVPFSFANLQWTFSAPTAPVANAGPNQTAAVGSTVTLNGSGSSNPSGAGTLTYTWTFTTRPAGSIATLNNPSSVTPTFVVDVAGAYAITLTVSNGVGPDSDSVTVSTINSPPVAKAGPNQTVAVGATVTLNGSGSSDVDGNPLTYSWTLTSRPAGSAAALTGATSVSAFFIADKAGTYAARLNVNDGTASSAPSTVTINTSNTPPVANAGSNQTVNVGAVVQLNGAGSTDVDGDALTYQWSLVNVPGGSAAALSSTTAVNPTFPADRQGTYVAQLIVRDSNVGSAPNTVTITTNAVQAPAANAGPNQTVKHGSLVTLSGSGTDPQERTLTFQWSLITKPGSSTASLSSTIIAQPAFVADVPGTYVAQLIVSNNFLNSAPSTVTITTTNTAPVANAGPNQTVPAGTLITLNGSGSSDADGDALTFSWSVISRPAGSLAVLSAANSPSPTLLTDSTGTYVFQLIVSDRFTSGTPKTVTITATNTAPVANAGPNQTVPAGTMVTLNGSGSSDADGDALTFSWSVISRPPGSVAVLSAANSPSPAFPTDSPGTYVFRLTVSDRFTSGTPAAVTITATNTAPEANAGPNQTVPAGTLVTLNGSGSSDTDGDALTFAWSVISRPADSVAVLSAANSTSPTLLTDSPGPYVFQLIVSDRFTSSAPKTVTITATNTAPVANAGPDQSVPAGTLVTLNGSGSSDADGDALTFAWSVISRPAGSIAVLAAANSASPTLLTDSTGTYVFQLIVSDRFTSSAPKTVTITATNSAPVANAGPDQSVLAGTLVTLNGSGSADADGDALTYSWSVMSQPAGSAAMLSAANTPSPTLLTDLTGTYVFQLIVRDRLTSSDPATVTITATNTAPAANAGPDQTVPAGALVTLNGSGSSDADGDTLTYSWSVMSQPAGSVAALSAANSPSPTLLTDFTGAYVFQLIVRDRLTSSTTATVTITATDRGTIVLPENMTVGLSLTAPFPVRLSAPAPQGGVTVALTTGDGSRAALSSTNVFIPQDAVQPATQPLLTALNVGPVTIGASARAYTGAAQMVLLTATISLSPAELTIDGVDTKNLDLTLSAPAPAGGFAVNVGSSNVAVAAAPAIVTIPQNATTVKVPVTGITPGTAVIRASAPHVMETQASVTVNRLDILLPANVIVPVGESALFPVALARPAEQATFIALASSDESKVTVSLQNVFINAGQTHPGGSPRVRGLATGAATITATAIGLNTARTTVQAGFAFSFMQSNLAVPVTETRSVLLRLSGPAPQSGLAITLTSSNPDIATVPPVMNFGALGTTVSVPITGAAQGSAIIRASAPNIPDATITVSVEGAGAIVLPSGATVAASNSLAFPVSLPTPAPAGGVTVTLASSDTGKATISPAQVTFTAGATEPATQPAVTGISAGTANINASAPGYASVSRTVQVIATAAQINPVSGTPQSSTIGTPFPAPLVAIVRDAAGQPVSGATVTFTAPATGPGAGFTGGVTTAVTNASGVATSAVLTANGSAGEYVVTASVPGVHPPAAFSLTNTNAAGGSQGTIAITPAIVGQNLQKVVDITLPQPAPAGGLRLTITSGDPARLLVAGRPADAGVAQIAFTVSEGFATAGIYVQGLAGSGTVQLTASAENLLGTASIVLTPSGLVLSGPNGLGVSNFTISLGNSTQLTLAAARLDSSLNYVETQQIRGGSAVTVQISEGTVSAGSVSPASVILNGGAATAATTFTAQAIGVTTVTAVAPGGFNVPAQAANTLIANVISSVLLPPDGRVGRNLQTPARVRLTSPAPSPELTITLASSDPAKLLFSTSPGTAGSESITLPVAAGRTSTAEFYIQGLSDHGAVTYTATAPGFASALATVTLAPSAFVLHSPFGLGADFFTTLNADDSELTISPALLDATGNVVESQQTRGGLTLDVVVTSWSPAVGTVTTSPVTFIPGTNSATTHFHPVSPGATILAVNAGPSYSTPPQASLTATVKTPGLTIETGVTIGKNLQATGTVLLGQPAPAGGLPVTLTSNSGELLLSASATAAGLSSITITIPAGESRASYFMQARADSGMAAYTASAPGYTFRTADVTFAPSGVVIAGASGFGFPLDTALSDGPQQVMVFTALLEAGTGSTVMTQPLAGGSSLLVAISNSNPAVGTIVAQVTISGGFESITANFTPISTGSATLSATTPAGYTPPRDFASLSIVVE